jgi:hypothetical protein
MEQVEQLLLEGRNSGPGIQVTPEFWQSLRADFAERLAKEKAG